MSNPLYERASRIVSIALVPTFLALGAVIVWWRQPIDAVSSSSGATAGRTEPAGETLVIDDPRPLAPSEVRVDTPVRPAAPRPIAPPPSSAATAPTPTRHCEEYALYGAATEKVLICRWL
jgi:hypothetical protein